VQIPCICLDQQGSKFQAIPLIGAPFGAQPSRASDPVPTRTEIETALRRLAPRIPPHEFGAVVDHARDSRGLKGSTPETAAWLSLVAYVRHALTDYDELLAQGYDHDSARFFVAAEIQAMLERWGVGRRLATDD